MPLDLLVPGLVAGADMPAPMRDARFAHVEKWLARAQSHVEAGTDAMPWLAAQFGVAAPVPFAAIAMAGEERPAAAGADAWMRADPVHLRIVEDHLELHDAAGLDVTAAEADALVAALAAHFAADGFEWNAAAPDRWYVRVPSAELPRTTPLAAAVGRDVYGLLPVAAPGASFNWRSAITEAQMVLASHEVNAARERRAIPSINSVWLWGEGRAAPLAARPYALVHAGDPFARGLARLSGAEARALPRSIGEVDLVRREDRALAVVDALPRALHRGGVDEWRSAAEALDAAWFGAMAEAIDRFGEVRVILPSASGTRVASLTPAARWRWFRARRPLSQAHPHA